MKEKKTFFSKCLSVRLAKSQNQSKAKPDFFIKIPSNEKKNGQILLI